tara:strand:+ start:1055 stop:1411 length:357 start_codon:yes stop_codon:yes gene_type:complete
MVFLGSDVNLVDNNYIKIEPTIEEFIIKGDWGNLKIPNNNNDRRKIVIRAIQVVSTGIGAVQLEIERNGERIIDIKVSANSDKMEYVENITFQKNDGFSLSLTGADIEYSLIGFYVDG